jgi:dGTPase
MEMRGLNSQLGLLRALSIGQLIDACTEVFIENEKAILDASFDKALTDICRFKEPLNDIAKLSIDKIYRTHSVVEIEAAGHEILPALVTDFIKAAENISSGSRKYQNMSLLFPEEIRIAITESKDTYTVLRNVIDFISGLTDRHALSLYRKIKGISF